MHKIAKQNNGECLSFEYVRSDEFLVWKCKMGHIFEKKPRDIRKSWCPECFYNKKPKVKQLKTKIRRNLKDIQCMAKKRGGTCVSQKFEKMSDRIKWKCSSGHVWIATAASVKKGSWCPKCRIHFTEEKCRYIAEQFTGVLFPQKCLDPLDNRVFKKKFQLDLYNEIYKIAFEYNGKQHYHFDERLHKTKKQFLLQQKKDKEKSRICKKMGIKLFNIPYNVAARGDSPLVLYIQKRLVKSDVPLLCGCVDLKDFYPLSPLEKMRKIATSRGGKCLSDEYVSANHRLFWECACGNRWHATAGSITAGSWCEKCARKKLGMSRRLTIEQMQELANKNGIKCISKEYIGCHEKLEWECECGNTWMAVPDMIRKGYLCRVCKKKK